LIEPLRRGVERPLNHRAEFGRQAGAQDEHAVLVHVAGDRTAQALVRSLPGFLQAVAAAPCPRHAFHLGGRGGVGEIEQARLIVWSGHPGERADLRVGDLAALQRAAQAGQRRQRLGDTHLLSRRAHVDAGAPREPMRARHEAGVPALLLVELAKHDEQFMGGGVQP
jgi:hypothetical protein